MRKAVKFLLEHQHAGLFLDPGLRKTSISLAAFSLLKKHKTAKGMFVLAPLRPCHMVWPAEVKKWADFNHLKVVNLCADGSERRDKLLAQDADIYILNFENIQWMFGESAPSSPMTKGLAPEMAQQLRERYEKAYEAWKEEQPKVKARIKRLMEVCDILLVDELSKMKDSQTARFKAIKGHLYRFARRWGLTGSPAANGLLDLFGQMYILDEGGALSQYLSHYRNHYFTTVPGNAYQWVLQDGAEELIYERIAPLVLRMAAEDYITMPKKLDNLLRFNLPEKAQLLYDRMETDLFSIMDKGAVTVANAASLWTKLAQIASGGVYLDNVDEETGLPKGGKAEWELVHNAKTDIMLDLMGELQGKQLFIAYHYQHDLDRIFKGLKVKRDTAWMLGKSIKQDKLMESLWNRGEIPWLIGHPQSVGHGLNLQDSFAEDVFFYTYTHDFDTYDQFIRRIRRSGNTAAFTRVHHAIARGTVDEAKLNALRTKNRNQNALFEALKAYRAAKKSGKSIISEDD